MTRSRLRSQHSQHGTFEPLKSGGEAIDPRRRTLFAKNLKKAFALIAGQPRIGSRATNVKVAGVQRIYLPVIKQFLYFHLSTSPARVEVVALWHARRESGPPI